MTHKLKCWRKDINRKQRISYDSKKGGFIDVSKLRGNIWRVNTAPTKSLKQLGTKEFKTKSKALKFAKSYMKKHDKC